MEEISFTIPLSGTVRIRGDSVVITLNRVSTTLKMTQPDVTHMPEGMNIFDILLESAQNFVASNRNNRFSPSTLYYEAVGVYPFLKQNTWAAHFVASAVNHPSHKYHTSKRDYFTYHGKGVYSLRDEYLKRLQH